MSLSGLSGLSPLRRMAVALAVATAAAVLAPLPATAEVATTPTITAPTAGAVVVSSPMLVSADSGAAFVRFVVAGQVEQTVAVSGGSAVTEIPVHGLSGSTGIDAYDCDSLVSCGATPASITVDVDLKAPEIIAPSRNNVVGSSVTVKVKSLWGGALRFYVDGSPAGKVFGSTTRLAKTISLKDLKDGDHVLSVQQCNSDGSICDGGTDSVRVIKDTKAPNWSDVSTSNRTVYPVKDNYKDSTQLSARVSENVSGAKVEIRKAGGPVVRTLKLGRVDAGRVKATWNGRKGNGDIVPKGKYTFRFIGTDRAGLVGKSNDKVVYVSDKQLVRKNVTKTVSALGSGVDDFSGDCSDVVGIRYLDGYGRDWRGGLQWRSNVRRNCSGEPSFALSAHVARTEAAVRYGSFQISAYGGGALTRGGPARILYVKDNRRYGATQSLGASLGWHKGDRVKLEPYLFGTKLLWVVAAQNGNWYDIKEFRISYTVSVLR